MSEHKTDLSIIRKAALSTAHDVHKEKINPAIAFIFQRFQAPITNSFSRALNNNQEKAEDKFAEFSVYLIENRKQIFRGFNPEKGRLQSYLYKIAHRHLSQRKKTRSISLESLLENKSSNFTPDQSYEAECIDILVNMAMKALKVKNPEGYRLLKEKYLSEEAPSSQKLAIQLGRVKENADEKELKKAQNLVDQQISKARKDLRSILERKIRKSLSFLEPKETDIQEELSALTDYIPWISIKD